MTGEKRGVLFALLVMWGAAVAALTLVPGDYVVPLSLQSLVCVGCHGNDTADIILNWLLFLPCGVLVAMAFDMRRAVVSGACLSLLIEVLQIGIPGRHAGLQDLIFNSLGALSGALVVRHGLGPRARSVVGALVAAIWISPVLLLLPTSPDSALYGLWTRDWDEGEVYGGRILNASVGGVAVDPGLVTDQDALAAAVAGRGRIELLLEVGPKPDSFVPLFEVGSEEYIDVMTVALIGDDVMLTVDAVARVLDLYRPAARWPGVMAGLVVGDTVNLVIERDRGSGCLSVGLRTRCNGAPSLGDGADLLVDTEDGSGWLAALLGLAWSVWLGIVIGATSPKALSALLRGLAVAAVGLVAAVLSPDVRPDLMHASLLVAGAVVAAGLRGPFWSLGVRRDLD